MTFYSNTVGVHKYYNKLKDSTAFTLEYTTSCMTIGLALQSRRNANLKNSTQAIKQNVICNSCIINKTEVYSKTGQNIPQ